jgi:anaerobic magnesium-protoporphyrin IX monomethyl ester cyclase
MHVRLLFPAATDPRAPHLAIPSLAAHLRASGIRTTVADLDLEALEWVLEPARLTAAAEQVARRLSALGRAGADDSAVEAHRWLVEWGPALPDAVPRAVAALRDAEAFLDPDRHHEARGVVNTALELVSAAHGSVRYAISSAAYDVAGCDASRLDDLVRVTGDPALDLFDEYHREHVLAALERDPPDVVGVSILNRQQIIPGLRIARLLKERGWFVVLGGTVYAKFPDELRTRPRFFEVFCDGVVPYEGETALVELAELVADGRRPDSLAAVPNLVWADNHGTVHANATHLEDVATLPTPDFSGLPLERYLAPWPVLPILTGKGCYFNRCKFCDIPAINRISPRPYRVRPAARVADDVAALQERFGARHFVVTDEALSPRYLLELADALADRPAVDARFVGYARLEPGFTPRVYERLHRMGVRKLFFGLESGSQAVLDHMDKGLRLGAARRALRDCAAAGIAAHVFTIVGFPEETEAQARETVQFLLDEADTLAHPAHTFDVHRFGLDLRTAYHDGAAGHGVAIDESEERGRDFPISVVRWRNTRGLSDGDVDRLLADFGAQLRARYAGPRHYPVQQWPGFEEYAVLYGDAFGDRPFPWRMALPEPGDPQPYRLMWAGTVRFEPGDADEVAVHTPETVEVVRFAALRALAEACGPAPVDGLLGQLAARVPHRPEDEPALVADLRAVVDQLLGSRALWLRPVGVEGAVRAVGQGPVGP